MTNTPKKPIIRTVFAASVDNPPPVYFLSLEIERVLCFKDRQVLDLSNSNGKPAQWTVILGNNGVGKTTLLRCLAGMEVETRVIIDSDDREHTYIHPLLFIGFTTSWKEVETLKGDSAQVNAQVIHSASLLSLQSGEDEDFFSSSQKFRIEVNIGRSCTAIPLDKLKGLVCNAYGALRRLGETALSESLPLNSASLFSEEASLINAEEWLLQTDYAVKSASGETRDRLQKQLTQIFEILKRILPEIEDVRIAVDEDRPWPKAEFLTPYGWVHMSSLGLGYRTAIAWMVDLAVRLFRRYPDSPDPLAEPAIVLVDEIDLHLHPKWQRTIMSFLTERFPNTQFIVTAHSPLVVQAAKDANIVLLRREGDRVVIDNNPKIIENWRVDQILTSVFELPTARSTDLEPLLCRREEILSKATLTQEDEAELKTITEQIGSLPTAESPQDIEAMNIIRRAAKLLES